jgi:ABC-type glycerol-3-phosphate transport system permease component
MTGSIAIVVLMQRRLIRGLTLGAVKGRPGQWAGR